MATYIPKLKWAWQAQCLSHTLLILKIYTTFKDVQMMLKHFFDISTGFRYKKNGKEFSVHLQRRPWIGSRTSTEGSGKNEKKNFFLLGFKYTLRTCFESKNFLPKSCPELSNQVLSFSEGQIYQQFGVLVRQSVFNQLLITFRNI